MQSIGIDISNRTRRRIPAQIKSRLLPFVITGITKQHPLFLYWCIKVYFFWYWWLTDRWFATNPSTNIASSKFAPSDEPPVNLHVLFPYITKTDNTWS